jgi:PTS system beta-glucosides-specific IIC component
MQPVIPLLIAGGLIKLIIILLDFTGVFTALGQTKELLTIISDAPFYFLPIMVAVSSAKLFQVNPFYAVASASAMLLPDFVTLMEREDPVSFIKIPVYQTSYSYGVLPFILLIYIMTFVVKGLEKILPSLIKDIFLPMLTILFTALLGILLIGPISAFLSSYLSEGISYLQNHLPVLAWILIDAMFPLLVITGMHWIFVTIAITQLGMYGVESGVMVGTFILSMTISAAALAVFLKTKNAERKKVAISSGLTTFFTGTSEPCLFGVCLPYRIPLVTSMIAGGIAGIYHGIVTIHGYVFAFPGIVSILMFSSPSEPGNLPKALIAGSIGFTVSFLLTFVLYRDSKDSTQN